MFIVTSAMMCLDRTNTEPCLLCKHAMIRSHIVHHCTLIYLGIHLDRKHPLFEISDEKLLTSFNIIDLTLYK